MALNRNWITPLTAGAFLLTAVTGILLFFHVATGLNKVVHEWLSWILVAGVILHLTVNFTPFRQHLRQRRGKILLGLFILVLLGSFAPLGGKSEPPYAPPLRALAQAPLTTLAQVARISPEELRNRLSGEGIQIKTDQQSLNELVGPDLRRQTRLLGKIFAAPDKR